MRAMGRLAVIAFLGACSFHGSATILDANGRDDAPPLTDGAVDGPPDAPVLPMLVQQITKYADNGATLAVNLTASPIAGNVLIMVGASNHGLLMGVTGGGVATWTRATQSHVNADVEIWFGVTDGSSRGVTLGMPGNPGAIWMEVSEWSGLDAANLLDQATAAAGTTSPASAGSITTTSRDLVIFGIADLKASTLGTPAGTWTAMTGIANLSVTQSEWYQLAAPAVAIAPTVTETSHMWDAAIVALRISP